MRSPVPEASGMVPCRRCPPLKSFLSFDGAPGLSMERRASPPGHHGHSSGGAETPVAPSFNATAHTQAAKVFDRTFVLMNLYSRANEQDPMTTKSRPRGGTVGPALGGRTA